MGVCHYRTSSPGWASLRRAKRIPGRHSLCRPLTIKTNPRESARQDRELSRNKIAHRRFCTFRTSSRHAYPSPPSFQALSLGTFTFNCKLSIVNIPPRPPALQHFHRPHSPFLLSSFCLLVSSTAPSELYSFVFFSLRNLSNKRCQLAKY